MLVTSGVFMLVSLIISFGLTTPIIKQLLSTKDIWGAKQSYYLSEAGIEDVMFRLKDSTYNSKLSTEEMLSINNYETITTISTDTLTGNKMIKTSESNYDGYKRKIGAEVTQSE